VKSFSLQGKENKESLIPSSRKNYKILYFGFTSCPDICPMTLSKLTSALKKKELLKDIDIYLIDLDWKRDDGIKAHDYAQNFGHNVYGLSANQNRIEEIAAYYKVYFKFKEMPASALEYTIDHSSFLYLLSPENKLLKVYSSDKDLSPFIDIIEPVITVSSES